MKKLSAFVLLGIFSFTGMAHAQEGYPPECRVLERHKPAADATYQPGIDVHGKPVVPADVNGGASIGMGGQSLVVPLTIDLAERLQNQNIAGLNLEGTLGFLEFQPNGRVLYNGQDLTPQMQVLCEKKPEKTTPAADRQTSPDTVKYAPVKENKPVLKAPAPAPAPVKTPAEPEKGELLEGGAYKE